MELMEMQLEGSILRTQSVRHNHLAVPFVDSGQPKSRHSSIKGQLRPTPLQSNVSNKIKRNHTQRRVIWVDKFMSIPPNSLQSYLSPPLSSQQDQSLPSIDPLDLTSLLLQQCPDIGMGTLLVLVAIESLICYAGLSWMVYMVVVRAVAWEWLLSWAATLLIYLLTMVLLMGRDASTVAEQTLKEGFNGSNNKKRKGRRVSWLEKLKAGLKIVVPPCLSWLHLGCSNSQAYLCLNYVWVSVASVVFYPMLLTCLWRELQLPHPVFPLLWGWCVAGGAFAVELALILLGAFLLFVPRCKGQSGRHEPS